MKKLNTLKKIFTLALCAAVAAASFISCSNGTEDTADTAAVLTLSADGTSRSVLPSANLAGLTSLSLTGTPDGGTVATLGTWSSYSDMTAAQIAVAPGTWSFTLNASNSGAALSGTVTGRTVTAGTNALSFSLAVSSYTKTGAGNIDVSLTSAPGSVAEVTAGLFTSDGTAVSGYGAETVTPTDSGTDKTASYTKSGVPSGTYVLIFKFYGGTGETLFLNRWRESVTVADGLTSSASVTVENLNTVYDIAYVYNGGSLKSGETATLSYVGKTGAPLTAAEKVERTGYTFAGWYGDSAFSGSAVTEIAAGQSGAKTFYAKWTANVYYLTIDAQGGTPDTMKFYEKYDTGWYTDEACTNEITSDTVLTVPTRSGYAFVGIYGATDGSGDCYITAAGKKTDAVTNTIISGNSVTLYAVWKSSAKQLLTFGFTDSANSALPVDVVGTIDQSAHTVAVIVPYATVTALVATFTCSDSTSVTVGSTAQTSGNTENDFTNAVTYTVTAEDGSTQTYAVTVTVDLFCEKIWYLSSGTGGSDGTNSSYVWFGVWPQTIRASSGVTVYESTTKTMGGATYYKGSDGYWYAKVKAKTYNNATNYTFTDGTTVTSGTEYYFKVEPIKWRVLESGKLLAESILANVAYYPYYNVNRTIENKTVYPNNYKESRIRAYLNGLSYEEKSDTSEQTENTAFSGKGFLQTAFTDTAQTLIATTNVDNSVASTTDADSTTTNVNGDGTNPYACGDTSDKIYLLSELEVTNNATYKFGAYDETDTKTLRLRTVSDYARATEAYMYTTEGVYQYRGWWWLRSPCNDISYDARGVNSIGFANNLYKVDRADGGVVPALTLAP